MCTHEWHAIPGWCTYMYGFFVGGKELFLCAQHKSGGQHPKSTTGCNREAQQQHEYAVVTQKGGSAPVNGSVCAARVMEQEVAQDVHVELHPS